MERFLARDISERDQAFQQAAGERGLPKGSIEKDFWVCFLLRELFGYPQLDDRLTFKGGTSLSKAWGLIDRFSEDLDLTIDREILGFGGDAGPANAPSRNERERRLKGLKQACQDLIALDLTPWLRARIEAVVHPKDTWSLVLDDQDPDGQTLLFTYPKEGAVPSSGYVLPVVKLEFGSRGDPWPREERSVTAIVAEVFPGLFDTPAVQVQALRPERTFWEKVMLLHEERFRPTGSVRRPRLARHYYDVWCLIEAGIAARAAADARLFGQVAAHRQVYFRRTWVRDETIGRGTIDMTPHPEHLDDWRQDYEAMRGEMFGVEPPPFGQIVERIGTFQAEFNAG